MQSKIITLNDMVAVRKVLAADRKQVVFTNGCFDILHRGHAEYLRQSRGLGDALIVGLNSDASVGRIKGAGRPVVPWEDRAYLLAALESVSYVVEFEEDTPLKLITAIVPDILIKGSDYKIENIVGRDVVEAHGGKVMTIPLVENRSTTTIIDRILALSQQGVFDD